MTRLLFALLLATGCAGRSEADDCPAPAPPPPMDVAPSCGERTACPEVCYGLCDGECSTGNPEACEGACDGRCLGACCSAT